MGPIWGRQDPDGPHVGPMNFAILECFDEYNSWTSSPFTYPHLKEITTFDIMPLLTPMIVYYTILITTAVRLVIPAIPIVENHGGPSWQPHEVTLHCLISCSEPHATTVSFASISGFKVVTIWKVSIYCLMQGQNRYYIKDCLAFLNGHPVLDEYCSQMTWWQMYECHSNMINPCVKKSNC